MHCREGEVLKLDENSYTIPKLGLTKNEYLKGNHRSKKLVKKSGIDLTLLKYNCIDGSSVNGSRHPILYSFALYKRHDYKKKIKNRITIQ